MKFICNNEKCSRKGVEDEYLKNLYKVINGKLVSDNAPCPECGEIREEIDTNSRIPLSKKNIGMGKYSSSSPEQQREMLKKRSHEHYKKAVEPFKQHQLHTAMENMKNYKKG